MPNVVAMVPVELHMFALCGFLVEIDIEVFHGLQGGFCGQTAQGPNHITGIVGMPVDVDFRARNRVFPNRFHLLGKDDFRGWLLDSMVGVFHLRKLQQFFGFDHTATAFVDDHP